jgi:O-antigen ligase
MSKKTVINNKKNLLELFLSWGVVMVCAVLPLLYFSGRAASYVTSKQYFLIGAVDVLIILWAWLLLSDERYRLTKKNLLYLLPLFLFLLSQTVSAFVGVDMQTSFFSKLESGTGLILLYHAFILACIMTSLIRVQQKRILKYFFQANLLSSTILAGFTFFTGLNGVFMTSSVMLNGSSGGAMMGNSLLVGAYFIFSIFLSIYLIAEEKKTYKKVVYYIGIGCMIFSPIYFNAGLFKGQSITSVVQVIGEARIATVSLVAGLLTSLFIWFSMQKEKKNIRISGMVGLVLGATILIVGIQQLATPHTKLNDFLVAESGNRLVDWKESVQGIKEKPLLGWGPENFHVVYQKYLDPVVFDPGHGNEVWALHPHNNTLEVLVNSGIIGFLLYALVFTVLFVGIGRLYKKGVLDRKAFALLIGMFVAFILQQQMIYESIVSYTMLFVIVAIVAGLSDVTDEQKQYRYITGGDYAIGTIVLLAMIPIWLYGAVFPSDRFKEFQQIADAHSDARANRYEHLFHSNGSYTVDTDPEFYTDPLFYSYDAQKVAIKANPMYQKVASEELASLVSAVDPIWQSSPYNYHLSLSLVNLQNLRFYLVGDTALLQKADVYAKRAFELSPTDPQIYFAYAQTLAYENNPTGAKALLDKAVSLNQNYTAAVEYRKTFK